MSEHGLEPLSLFLILCRALWNTCEFRALFEISGSYELGATLWGTEQYNKWAPLKTNHCSWPLSNAVRLWFLWDRSGSPTQCTLGFNFGLESWEGPRKIHLSIFFKRIGLKLFLILLIATTGISHPMSTHLQLKPNQTKAVFPLPRLTGLCSSRTGNNDKKKPQTKEQLSTARVKQAYLHIGIFFFQIINLIKGREYKQIDFMFLCDIACQADVLKTRDFLRIFFKTVVLLLHL